MDNLIFCLNVTVPIFSYTAPWDIFSGGSDCLMKHLSISMNKFVFVIPLPVLLFQDIAKIDIYEAWDPKMVLFCFADHIAQYYDLRAPVPFSPPFRYPGRVYPGILPQQRSDPWYRHYPEPLRKCRYGTTDDHCQRPSLQCNGCCSSLCL